MESWRLPSVSIANLLQHWTVSGTSWGPAGALTAGWTGLVASGFLTPKPMPRTAANGCFSRSAEN